MSEVLLADWNARWSRQKQGQSMNINCLLWLWRTDYSGGFDIKSFVAILVIWADAIFRIVKGGVYHGCGEDDLVFNFCRFGHRNNMALKILTALRRHPLVFDVVA